MPAGDSDVVRGVLSMTMVNGDVAKNVFTWIIDKVSVGDYSDAAIGDIVSLAIESVFAEVVADLTEDMSFDTIDVYKRVLTDWDYLVTNVPNITPTQVGEVMPPGVAALMTGYTSLNRVFGRKFFYGYTEADIDSGVLGATALGDLADAALEYITAFNGGSMGPADFLVPGVWSTKVAAFVPFGVVAVVKDTMSYQRRRKTGVGV